MTFDCVDNILLEETQKRVKQSYFDEKDLSYTFVEDGYILPYKLRSPNIITGGVVTEDGKYIRQSGVNETVGDSYDFDKSKIEKTKKTVVYLGMFFPVWGHCITDSLRKLWFINTQEFKDIINQGADVVCINVYNSELQNFQYILKSLVRNIHIVEIKEVTQYQKIYIPDDSIYSDEKGFLYYTKTYLNQIQTIINSLPDCNVKTYDKIYFSRSAIPVGRDYGEKRIEDVFKYLGYKIIYPEKLSFREQITLLQHCTHFAATEGSVSHNSVFCKPRTKVCIIRKCEFLNEYQFMINQMAALDVTYVDSHLSICIDKRQKWKGPFFLYANDNLLRYAGIPYVFNSFSLRLFRKYAKKGYALYKNEMEISEFYAMRLFDEMNTSYFCKNWVKRFVRYILSHGNLSILVPLYKRIMKYRNRKSLYV